MNLYSSWFLASTIMNVACSALRFSDGRGQGWRSALPLAISKANMRAME